MHEWANALYFYPFSSELGKNIIQINPNINDPLPFDIHDTTQVINLMNRGIKDHGEKYINIIMNDMQLLGYDIESISIGIPGHNFPIETLGMASNI